MPIARAYSAIPEPTNATAVCIASEPALQANSMSAALTAGVAPMASATIVELGFTAFGFDSVPTHTARIFWAEMFARLIAFREASMDIVTVSSSREGTDFCLTGRDPLPAAPHVDAMALVGTRGRGTYAP